MTFILANAGLPMLGIQMRIMVAALLPIVVIEALVIGVRLSQRASRSLKASLLANAVSTFAGIPLTWFALLMVEVLFGGNAWGLETPFTRIISVTLQAPLLIPYEDSVHWMVPAASLFLMFPFLTVSAFVEAWVLSRLWPEVSRSDLQRTVWIANALTYSFLIAFCGIGLYRALSTTPERDFVAFAYGTRSKSPFATPVHRNDSSRTRLEADPDRSGYHGHNRISAYCAIQSREYFERPDIVRVGDGA